MANDQRLTHARRRGLRPAAGYAASVVAVLAVGGACAGIWWSAVARGFWPASSQDTFSYFFPSLRYLADSLATGVGVFWTRLQNCGQPAFGNGQVGALYPPNALFLILDPRAALAATDTFHLLLGPLGMLYLARQLRLHPAAALTGALALMAGDYSWMLAYWQPTVLAPYMWIPWALGLSEHVLRQPRYASVVALGAVLTLQLLAGFPQISLFTYQVIALRLLYELVPSRRPQRWRRVAAVAAAALLPVGLAAVKLLPAIELARLSIRAGGLGRADIIPGGMFHQSWAQFREQLPLFISQSFVVAPWGVGFVILALCDRPRRRFVLFYLATTLVFFALSFDNLLLDAYMRLPLGTLFRMPVRFRWMASVSAALLVAVGTQVFCRALARGGWPVATATVVLLLGVSAWAWLAHAVPTPTMLGGLYGAAAAAAVALVRPRSGPGWRWCVAGCVGAMLLAFAASDVGVTLAATGDRSNAFSLWRRASELRGLSAAMTLQDRVYFLPSGTEWSVLEKSPSLFRIAGVADYEPQTSLRFANYLLALRGQGPYAGFMQFELGPRAPRRRALLNLAAARFVVDNTGAVLHLDQPMPPLRDRFRDGRFAVMENPAALPRAFYVPTAEVVADSAMLLARLGTLAHDPRRVALVETRPADGFLGATPAAKGSATIRADRSEELEIDIAADAPGFLFLSDQDYPGWEATVNDVPAPILRANYAFRLVRVPAGASTVVFRYRPRSVWVGALLSAATLLLLGLIPMARRVRRRPTFAPMPG